VASDTLEFVQGDANLVLTGTAIDATTKSVINLTGYDLTVFFWSAENEELVATLTANVTSPLTGGFEVTMTEECLANPGNFDFELQLTKGSIVQTAPSLKRASVRPQRG
jgi:hypothetical protein